MEGLTHAQMVVLQLPPRMPLKSLVNLLSLNGTWFMDLLEARADTQLLRAAIDLLIVLASSSLIPSEPVLLRRSDPAKSTIVRRAFLKNFFLIGGMGIDYVDGFVFIISDCSPPDAAGMGELVAGGFSVSVHLYSTSIYRTAWDLLEFLFMPVMLTFLRLRPIWTY